MYLSLLFQSKKVSQKMKKKNLTLVGWKIKKATCIKHWQWSDKMQRQSDEPHQDLHVTGNMQQR